MFKFLGECAAGMYHDKETGECTLCPAGEYQPNVGQTSCLSCPYLTALNKLGATKCPVPPGTMRRTYMSIIYL